jgi:hypothetical protein
MKIETNIDTSPLRTGGESIAPRFRLASRVEADETLTISTERDRSGRNRSSGDRPIGADHPERCVPGVNHPERDDAQADHPERDAPGANHPERDAPGADHPERDAAGANHDA